MRMIERSRGSLFTITSANSSSVASRPWVFTDSWNSVPCGAGIEPTTPAATCAFCSRKAATTSFEVRLRAASFCGSSQMRMA